MSSSAFLASLHAAFKTPLAVDDNFVVARDSSCESNQQQTNDVFTDKWAKYGRSEEKDRLYEFQLQWYLTLYGFESVDALREHLRTCRVILDAGCGLGYKAAWFAELAPHALVVGMDYSDAARQAAASYRHLPNLFFIKGDIAATDMRDASVDYVSCDQVIMHTEDPAATFAELSRITAHHGQFACYFYAKKALPRELLDDHFRVRCTSMSKEELWAMSEQLTELGRRLSELQVSVDVPAIPALGIKGGRQDIQRFLYWNFLKCFWNADLGQETSVVTNFDWYSPSNARRFDAGEVHDLVAGQGLVETYFHAEDACYSGRFSRP